MATFKEHPCTETLNYFRKQAVDLGCDPCFDGKLEDLLKMNDEGNDVKPSCLCNIGVGCPCKKWEKDSVTAEKGSMCYCEIFVRK